MPGAGKATVRKILASLGCATVVMGDEIREEVKRRRLKPTAENTGIVMLKLREEEGPDVVAKRCIQKIKKKRANLIIIDGIRSLNEVATFKEHFPSFNLLAVHTSPRKRFQRLFRRKRSDDPKNFKSFRARDLRELSVGLGNVIAMSDLLIINEGSKAQLKTRVYDALKSVPKFE